MGRLCRLSVDPKAECGYQHCHVSRAWEWDNANAVHRVAKVAGLDGRVFSLFFFYLSWPPPLFLHFPRLHLDRLYLLYLHLRLPIILHMLHLTCVPFVFFLPQLSFHSPWYDIRPLQASSSADADAGAGHLLAFAYFFAVMPPLVSSFDSPKGRDKFLYKYTSV